MRKVPKGWDWKERIWSRDSTLEDFYILMRELDGKEVPSDWLRKLPKRRRRSRRYAVGIT
jgi:hypothetical protein